MKTSFLIILLIANICCNAQNDTLNAKQLMDTKSYGVYLQYNGIAKPYLELGLGKSKEGLVGHHPFSTGIFISSEIKIDFNKTILAPKIGVWSSGGVAPFSIGLSLIYYSDISSFDNGSVRVRPEFGLGLLMLEDLLALIYQLAIMR